MNGVSAKITLLETYGSISSTETCACAKCNVVMSIFPPLLFFYKSPSAGARISFFFLCNESPLARENKNHLYFAGQLLFKPTTTEKNKIPNLFDLFHNQPLVPNSTCQETHRLLLVVQRLQQPFTDCRFERMKTSIGNMLGDGHQALQRSSTHFG